jgi:hypothetical protein
LNFCVPSKEKRRNSRRFFRCRETAPTASVFAWGRRCGQEQACGLFGCDRGRLTFAFFLGLMGWL